MYIYKVFCLIYYWDTEEGKGTKRHPSMPPKHSQQLSNRKGQQANPSLAYLYAKLERLSTAVYLITRFIPEGEPLRTELREGSLSLLSDTLVLKDNVRNGLQKMISLLDIAYQTKYISEMNWSVLRKEYVALQNFMDDRGDLAVQPLSDLSESFFDVGDVPEIESKAEVIEKVVEEIRSTSGRQDKEAPVIKDKTQPKAGQPRADKRQPAASPPRVPRTTEKKTDRRDLILTLFDTRESISVRDAADNITDVSEKTLQRELLSMVEEGILRKEGERRWSTYFKA